MRMFSAFFLVLLGCANLRAQENPLAGDEVTLGYLEAGFRALARNHRLEPNEGEVKSTKAFTWFDGVVGLPMSEEVEAEVIGFLKGERWRRDLVPSPVPGKGGERWMISRFLELRGKLDEALVVLEEGEVQGFERLARVRLFWRKGEMERAEKELGLVQDWGSLRIEMEVIHQVGGLEDYRDFLKFLREKLPAEGYRIWCYPVELDLAFHEEDWKGALEESITRGMEWRLAALLHFGEDDFFQKEWAEFRKGGGELSVEELCRYPAALVYDELKAVLNGDRATKEERGEVLKNLCQLPKAAGGDWLVEWEHFQPEQFAQDVLMIARATTKVVEARAVFRGILKDELVGLKSFGKALAFATREDEDGRSSLRALAKVLENEGLVEPEPKWGERLDLEFYDYFYLRKKWVKEDVTYLLSLHAGSSDRSDLEETLRRNEDFVQLSRVGKLRYALAGNLQGLLRSEIEGEEWTEEELRVLLGLIRYFDFKRESGIWRQALARWITDRVIEEGAEDDWLEWVDRWGRGLGGLGLSDAKLRYYCESLLVGLAKIRGEEVDGVLAAISPRVWERSTLEKVTAMLRSPEAAKAHKQSRLMKGGAMEQGDFDYLIGLTLLTVKEALPVMMVSPPAEIFFRSEGLPVLLPRRIAFLNHRRAKAQNFIRLKGALGPAVWAEFCESLFKMAGFPPPGEGTFMQEYHREHLADSDSRRMELMKAIVEWDQKSNQELRLAEVAMEYPRHLTKEQFVQLCRRYPRGYLDALSRRTGIRGNKESQLAMREVFGLDRGRTLEQKRVAELRGKSGKVAKMSSRKEDGFEAASEDLEGGVLQWVADHPRDADGVSLFGTLYARADEKKKAELVRRLFELGDEAPGGRRAMEAFIELCFANSGSGMPIFVAGSVEANAREYLKKDSGNGVFLRILVREVCEKGGDLNGLRDAFEVYRKERGLSELVRVLDQSFYYKETAGGVTRDQWRRFALEILYEQESGELHEERGALPLTPDRWVGTDREEFGRLLVWLEKGGQAGFSFWLPLAERLFSKGWEDEALEWWRLALTRSDLDPEWQERLGVGPQCSAREVVELVKREDFEKFCQSVAGQLREDLPWDLRAVILVGANDPRYHAKVCEAFRSEVHPKASISMFDRAVDEVRKFLRNHPKSAIFMVNLEQALFSDPELRVSFLSELVIETLPASERGAAVLAFWKSYLEFEGQRRSAPNIGGILFSKGLIYCTPDQFGQLIATSQSGVRKVVGKAPERRPQFVSNHPYISDGNLRGLMKYWSLGDVDPVDGFFPVTPSLTYRVQRLAGLSDEQYRDSQKDFPKGDWKKPNEMERIWEKILKGEFGLRIPVIEVDEVGGEVLVNWSLGGFLVSLEGGRKGVFGSQIQFPFVELQGEVWFYPKGGEKRLVKTLPKVDHFGSERFEAQGEGEYELRVMSGDAAVLSSRVRPDVREWKALEVVAMEMSLKALEMGPLKQRPCYHMVSQFMPMGQKSAVIGKGDLEPQRGCHLRSWIFHGSEVIKREVVFFNAESEELGTVPWREEDASIVMNSWKSSELTISKEMIPAGASTFGVRAVFEKGPFKFTPVDVAFLK